MSEKSGRTTSADRARMLGLAKQVGDDWRQAPYFDAAEAFFDQQWTSYVWPMVHDADFSQVIDLAAGHGRNSARLQQLAGALTIVDINDENIMFCRQRFAGVPHVSFLRNDGTSLEGIADASITLLYCFDAMVHFDSDIVRAYLAEAHRVLRPGGRGFCHHSNFHGNPGGDMHQNGGWRNFMSRELFAHYCAKEDLSVLRQRVIHWGASAEGDCLTLFERPGEKDGLPVVSQDLTSSELDAAIGEASDDNDVPLTEALLRRARTLAPASEWVALALAHALAAQGQEPAATAEYARGVSLAPGLATLHAHHARALLAVGERQAATNAALKALSLDPGDPVAADVLRHLSPS